MSATIAPIMTEDEARDLQNGAADTSRKLTRMSAAELARVAVAERATRGRVLLYGKPSKDELISEVMDLRGYTVARINEAIHVLNHDVVWPECPYCTAAASEVAA